MSYTHLTGMPYDWTFDTTVYAANAYFVKYETNAENKIYAQHDEEDIVMSRWAWVKQNVQMYRSCDTPLAIGFDAETCMVYVWFIPIGGRIFLDVIYCDDGTPLNCPKEGWAQEYTAGTYEPSAALMSQFKHRNMRRMKLPINGISEDMTERLGRS